MRSAEDTITDAVERAVSSSSTPEELFSRVEAAFGSAWVPKAYELAVRIKGIGWLPHPKTPPSQA